MNVLILTLIGLVAGFIGGMLGIGGSLIMIPAMTELLGPNQHLYQASAMIVNVFVAMPAVIQHRHANAINMPTVKKLLPVTIVSVLIGVAISEMPFFDGADGEPWLRAVFGTFLFAMVAYDLYRVFRALRNRQPKSPEPNTNVQVTTKQAVGVAIPTGLVAGMMGVGGGALAVPLQRRFMGVPVRQAIANSAAVIVGTAAIGAMAKNYAYMSNNPEWFNSLFLAVLLIPTAICGSLLGSKLVHKMPIRAVKTAFLCLMLVIAIRLTKQAWNDISKLDRQSTPISSSAVPAP